MTDAYGDGKCHKAIGTGSTRKVATTMGRCAGKIEEKMG